MAALQHLYIEKYILEVYLVGPFALVRDNTDHFVCVGQVGLIVVILIATALFQQFLCQSFWPLTQQQPLCTAQPTRPNNCITEKHVGDMHDNWLDEFTKASLRGRSAIV